MYLIIKYFLLRKLHLWKTSPVKYVLPLFWILSLSWQKRQNKANIISSYCGRHTLYLAVPATLTHSRHKISQHHKNQTIFQSNCCFHHQGRRASCKKKSDTYRGNSRPRLLLIQAIDCSEMFIPIYWSMRHLIAEDWCSLLWEPQSLFCNYLAFWD